MCEMGWWTLLIEMWVINSHCTSFAQLVEQPRQSRAWTFHPKGASALKHRTAGSVANPKCLHPRRWLLPIQHQNEAGTFRERFRIQLVCVWYELSTPALHAEILGHPKLWYKWKGCPFLLWWLFQAGGGFVMFEPRRRGTLDTLVVGFSDGLFYCSAVLATALCYCLTFYSDLILSRM